VRLGLSAAVSTAHLGTSMLFFALLVVIAWRSRPEERQPVAVVHARTRALLFVTLGALYAQILLGAAMRHLGAGLLCGIDLPWCRGTIWPSGAHYSIYMHILHRALGLAVLGLGAALAVSLRRDAREPAVRRLATALPLLLLAQVGLGVASILSLLGAAWVTAHLGVAAALLALLVALTLATRSTAAAPAALHPEARPDAALGSAGPA
jgi:heme A synthase